MRITDHEFDYPEPDELEPDDKFLDAIEECRAFDKYEADCQNRQLTGLDY